MNALVTGATKGIGRAIAFALANEGYSLVVCARNVVELEQLKANLLIIAPSIRVVTAVCDCSDRDDLTALTELATSELGFIDVLVNNVGLYIPASLLDESDEAFDMQLKTNLISAWYLCKYFGKRMREARKGHIFNVCSIASKKVFVNAGTYCVTKSGQFSLNNVLREELMPFGVKVTAILPGATLTDSWSGTDISASRMVSANDVGTALINALKMSVGANVDEITIRPTLGEI